MTSLVRELRAQLERVVRDPDANPYDTKSDEVVEALNRVAYGCDRSAQRARIVGLTAAIRAAVVTREAQP